MKPEYVDCVVEELKNMGGAIRLADGRRIVFSMFDVMANTTYDHIRIGDRCRWRLVPPGLSDPHPERWRK